MIRALSIVFALGNFLDAPITLLVAVYATQVYGSAVPLGLMFAMLGAGALVGSLWFGAVGHRWSRRGILALLLPAGGGDVCHLRLHAAARGDPRRDLH